MQLSLAWSNAYSQVTWLGGEASATEPAARETPDGCCLTAPDGSGLALLNPRLTAHTEWSAVSNTNETRLEDRVADVRGAPYRAGDHLDRLERLRIANPDPTPRLLRLAFLDDEGVGVGLVPVLRDAAGHAPHITVQVGELERAHPLRLRAERDAAAFALTGGLGYVPITFTGLSDWRGWLLERDDGAGWQPVNQAVHGSDFWQMDGDAGSGCRELTFTLPMEPTRAASFRLRRVPLADAAGPT